jgi:mannitol/fructose-specific phosphotransferase system IIA component (Ntr-type)
MIRIRETLLPDHVILGLTARSRDEGIRQLAESLRSDSRVVNWKEFLRALTGNGAGAKVNLQCGVAMPHVRTAAVTKMVMAFGRLKEVVQETDRPIQFLVLVGIPVAMDSEYLRLVGTLMRVFRSDKLRSKLRYANKPAEIIEIFEKGETGLEA